MDADDACVVVPIVRLLPRVFDVAHVCLHAIFSFFLLLVV